LWLDRGISTDGNLALVAFLILVSMSANGSLMDMEISSTRYEKYI
jgi:hypothetical protein